jgi:uncharacterized Zn finger protein
VTFYSSASNASLWRGIDYYKQGRVKSFGKNADGFIIGRVAGSDDNEYDVCIDISHPKRSTCNCPFANGRYVVCKHMIALYFTSTPGSYEKFEKDMDCLEVQYELEEEKWRKETLKHIKEHVKGMSAKQVREKLVDIYYQNALDNRYHDEW